LTPPPRPSQPKEKPLRIKRGHRKPSAFPNPEAPSSAAAATPGSTTFISQNLLVHSPSSDAFSAGNKPTNGVHKGALKKPGSAFDLYCDETRPSVKDKAKEGEADNVEEELSRGWKDLPDTQRDEYQSRADDRMAEYEKQKDEHDVAVKEAQEAQEAADAEAADADDADADAAAAKADREESNDKADSTESDRPAAGEAGEDKAASVSRQQEDVEMTNWDTDQETQGERPEE
jgi:hypothetical protein